MSNSNAIKQEIFWFVVTVLFCLTTPVWALDSTLPDSNLTPGAIRTKSANNICTTSTSTVRNVSETTKKKVRALYDAKYGIDNWCGSKDGCVIDHLVPLSVGGANSISNLWPEPHRGTWNSLDKDRLEARIRSLLCKGSISVSQAQSAFSQNWVASYAKYLPKAFRRKVKRMRKD